MEQKEWQNGMNETTNRGPLIGFSGILLISAAISGWLWLPPTIKSFRPPVPESVFIQSATAEDVPARLWQDPFNAVIDYRQKLHDYRIQKKNEPGTTRSPNSPSHASEMHEEYHTVPFLAKKIWNRVLSPNTLGQPRTKDSGYFVVMPVMLQGGQYAEAIEERRRQRYAVVAGLGKMELVPDNDQAIGFLETWWNAESWSNHQPKMVLPEEVEDKSPLVEFDIPFEWFGESLKGLDSGENNSQKSRLKQHVSEVLVLWLNENQLGKHPALMISDLLGHLIGKQGIDLVKVGRIQIAIIGPATSTTLVELLNEVRALKAIIQTDQGNGATESGAQTPTSEESTDKEFHPPSIDNQGLVDLIQEYLDGGIQSSVHEQLLIDAIEPCLKEIEISDNDQVDKWAEDFLDAGDSLRNCIEKQDYVVLMNNSGKSRIGTALSIWMTHYLKELPIDSNFRMAVSLSQYLANTGSFGFPFRINTAELLRGLATKIQGIRDNHWNQDGKTDFEAEIHDFLIEKSVPDWLGLKRLVRGWSEEVIPWDRNDSDLNPPASYVDIFPSLKFYSSRATIWEGLLDQSSGKTLESMLPSNSIQTIPQSFPTLVRTVSDDRQLVDVLLNEFNNRHILFFDSAGRKADHVALVGEWDTDYGRAFPETFRAAVCKQRNEYGLNEGAWPCDDRKILKERLTNVHQFQYLRGIDGLLPGENTKSPVGAGDENATPDQDLAEMQRPEGRSQLDYVQRLTNQIAALERELFPGNVGHIRAIGVVGSDVYDKQLILQCLRARFRRALFFTTDLDARLTHPSQYHWSRNLLIASSFGLTLPKPQQCAIPPFRGNYQTSTFFACKLALGDHMSTSSQPTANAPTIETIPGAPYLFEVARQGPYPITTPPSENPTRTRHPGEMSPGNPTERFLLSPGFTLLYFYLFIAVTAWALWRMISHQSAKNSIRISILVNLLVLLATLGLLSTQLKIKREIILSAVVVLFLFWLGAWWAGKQSPGIPRAGGWRQQLSWIGTGFHASLILLVTVILIDSGHSGGEPFELFQGISIWPTELIRLGVTFISVVFLANAIDRLRIDNRSYEARFGLKFLVNRLEKPIPIVDPDTGSSPQKIRWLQIRWNRLATHQIWRWRDMGNPEIETQSSVETAEIWRRYRTLGRWSNRLSRVLPLTIGYLGLSGAALHFLGLPISPARGLVAFRTDLILVTSSSLALAILAIFVLDANKLCAAMITQFQKHRTKWPKEAEEWALAERGLSGEEATEWLENQFIAKRTAVVNQFILLPFAAFFFLLLSRNSYFDLWLWPPSILLIFGFISVVILRSGLILRRAAESGRKTSLENLNRMLSILDPNDPKMTQRNRQIGMAIREIKNLNTGAFLPWGQHPLVRAVILPFGGVGAVVLLDFLSKMGF